MFGRLAAKAAPLLLIIAFGGCYLPVRFDAEIEISRFGIYNMVFDGYLVDVPLYNGLRKGKISAFEETGKIERLKTDMTRDSSIKEFKYYKQGHFKVHWEKSGDLLRTKMVTFVRRNENLFSIIYNKEKSIISVIATPMAKSTAKRLKEAGLNMQGQLRVKTDALVAKHNAGKKTKDKNTGMTVYVWDIKSILDPPAKLTLVMR